MVWTRSNNGENGMPHTALPIQTLDGLLGGGGSAILESPGHQDCRNLCLPAMWYVTCVTLMQLMKRPQWLGCDIQLSEQLCCFGIGRPQEVC